MQIEIRARGLNLDMDLRTFAERRLRFAAERLAGAGALATLRLQDLNGPRGGIDKLARMTLTLPGGVLLHAQAVSDDPQAAIATAAARLIRSARRHRGRRRTGSSSSSPEMRRSTWG